MNQYTLYLRFLDDSNSGVEVACPMYIKAASAAHADDVAQRFSERLNTGIEGFTCIGVSNVP